MKQLKHSMKLLTGLLTLVAFVSLPACGEKQQAATPEAQKTEVVKKETIVWKLAQTWGTGFPIFGDAVIKIHSYYKKSTNAPAGEFECGAGAFVAGVALRGTVVRLLSFLEMLQGIFVPLFRGIFF